MRVKDNHCYNYILKVVRYMKLFESFNIKNMTLKNRIVMPPMCMYSAANDGKANDFHFTHYTTRAIGGVGLIILEATGVTPIGRISDNDLGLWEDSQIDKLSQIVTACHKYGSKVAIQLAHAGRKNESLYGQPLAPSPLPFNEDYKTPAEMTLTQIKDVVMAFKASAIRADRAGFDGIEVHAAHGYLIHEFLSPLTNKRTDEYGGSLENRARLLREVLENIHEVWPKDKPIWIRVSASDYEENGIDAAMIVDIINHVCPLIDMAHVSSGGLLPTPVRSYPGYQVDLSETVREKCNIPTIAVGLLTNAELAEAVLQTNRCDLTAFGRELLRNPYFAVNAAQKYGIADYLPKAYERAYPHI